MANSSLLVGKERGDIGGLQHFTIQADMVHGAGEPTHPGIVTIIIHYVVGFLVAADNEVAAIAVEHYGLVGLLIELYPIPVHGPYQRSGIIGERYHMPVAVIHGRPSCPVYVVREIPVVAAA